MGSKAVFGPKQLTMAKSVFSEAAHPLSFQWTRDVVLNWSQSWLVAWAALASPRVSSFVFATKTNAILAMLLRTTILRGQWLWNAPGLLYIFVYYLDCSFHMESRIIIELWNDYWCRSTKNDDVLVLYRDKKRDWEAPNWGGLFCDIFKRLLRFLSWW